MRPIQLKLFSDQVESLACAYLCVPDNSTSLILHDVLVIAMNFRQLTLSRGVSDLGV